MDYSHFDKYDEYDDIPLMNKKCSGKSTTKKQNNEKTQIHSSKGTRAKTSIYEKSKEKKKK
jgi:hypothetical protein